MQDFLNQRLERLSPFPCGGKMWSLTQNWRRCLRFPDLGAGVQKDRNKSAVLHRCGHRQQKYRIHVLGDGIQTR
jgi:hypothetical protein